VCHTEYTTQLADVKNVMENLKKNVTGKNIFQFYDNKAVNAA